MPGYGNKGGGGGGRSSGMGAVGNCVCVKCGYSAAKKPVSPVCKKNVPTAAPY